jgi:hypothetical protein
VKQGRCEEGEKHAQRDLRHADAPDSPTHHAHALAGATSPAITAPISGATRAAGKVRQINIGAGDFRTLASHDCLP